MFLPDRISQGVNQTESMEQPERRSHERRKSRVNKLVHASLKVESVEFKTFLYLVDISLGGFRANLDRALAKGSKVEVSLPLRPFLNEEVELQALCRVAWNRELLGGTFVHGFEFQELQSEMMELVERLFLAFSPEGTTLAVSTLDGAVSLWDAKEAVQVCSEPSPDAIRQPP